MKLTFFSVKSYEHDYLLKANKDYGIQMNFVDKALSLTTVEEAKGSDAICVFANDRVSKEILKQLSFLGIKYVLLRCVGYDNVDLQAAKSFGIQVANVPAYSPESIAEYAVTLLLSLNRKISIAMQRVRNFDFSLDGLQGIVLKGRTAGIVGTGKIGLAIAKILCGFGMKVLAFDLYSNAEFENIGGIYVDLDTLVSQSDVISLNCPATPENFHLFNEELFAKAKDGFILINTGRGVLIDTQAAIRALKSGKLMGLGLDVYEGEEALFFNDHSSEIIQDDTIRMLLSFNNVVLTGHQAFLTQEALEVIAKVTFQNFIALSTGDSSAFIVG